MDEHNGSNGVKAKTRWALVGFIAVAAYFLVTEHKAHLAGWLNYLPYLLLLACPLLHLFMHGGHGSHRDDSGEASRQQHKEHNK